ncbi:hypothetical protein M758_9G053800 [Ceratodon purpureus]|nr:hypothetical protein M758_9G053800 [Ceratodon purpureus]
MRFVLWNRIPLVLQLREVGLQGTTQQNVTYGRSRQDKHSLKGIKACGSPWAHTT